MGLALGRISRLTHESRWHPGGSNLLCNMDKLMDQKSSACRCVCASLLDSEHNMASHSECICVQERGSDGGVATTVHTDIGQIRPQTRSQALIRGRQRLSV